MNKINWKEAQNAFIAWNEGVIPEEKARDLLNEAGVWLSDIETIFHPSEKFGGNFGQFSHSKFFVNVEAGDLFMINWIQNVPVDNDWVEITEVAFLVWTRRKYGK